MANPKSLIEKAARAAQSAVLLLGNGDIDGACNHAYYTRALVDIDLAAWVVDQAVRFVGAKLDFVGHLT